MTGKITLEGREDVIEVLEVELRKVPGSLPGFTKWIGSFTLPDDVAVASITKLHLHLGRRGDFHLNLDDGRSCDINLKRYELTKPISPILVEVIGSVQTS